MEEGQKKAEQRKSCYRTVVEVLKKRFNRLWLVSTLYATGVLFDYFIVYTVKINDDEKCIELNHSLGYTAFVFRSLLEILNMIVFFTTSNFKKFNFNKFIHKLRRKDTLKYTSKLLLGIAITRKEFPDFLMFQQFLSIVLVAIVCQVMVMISLTSESRERLILIALYYLLSLHLPRLCVVIAILLKRPKTSSSRFRTKLFRLFFFVFIYSNQLFAALWYFTAIYRETGCWKQAYKNSTGQSYPSLFKCGLMSQEKQKILNDYCSENTTKFDFGIYKSIHESGVLGESSLLMILYFSRWALQYLSSFAQGLEAGVNVWQNIFIIFIIVYAVFMFFFLIGEVQSEMEKFAKLRPKLREKKRWMGTKNIPEDLQSQIRQNEREKWPEIKDVTIENMFSNLPENVSGKLSEQLCLEQIKKVEEFQRWNKASLKELAACVKPIFYEKRTRVIQEKDPIDEMLFVVQGVLWTYPSRGGTIGVGSTSSCSNKNDHMKDGDFYGEELVKCIQVDPYSFNFPIATKTIQAVTNVEAFALMAYDLKNIFIKHRREKAALFILSYWRYRKVLRNRSNEETPIL